MACCDGNEKDDRSKGLVHWTIRTYHPEVSHIEIWGKKVQEVKCLGDLCGEVVYIRIFMKDSFLKRFIDIFKKDPEKLQKEYSGIIILDGYSGAVPILKIDGKRFFVDIVEKTREWPGYDYPPFKKAP